MRIKPFIAWRPPVNLAAQVASPPYDVVDTEEARAMAAGQPSCFLHVNRAEIDLPVGTDLYADEVYRQAQKNFKTFQDQGYLVKDSRPALYVYRLVMGTHSQTGVVVVCHVEDYERDIVKKHEKTRKNAEDDRTRYTSLVNANLGPVFLAYKDQARIDELIRNVQQSAPLFDFTAVDGIRHSIWPVPDSAELVRQFAAVPEAYIADGHHRAASAARVAIERRAANPRHTGEEEYNWFLAVLFPATQLQILPYNRCVRDLNGLSAAQFLGAVRERFAVAENAAPRPMRPTQVSMYLEGKWYGLSWTPEADANPVAALDVSVLQDRVLAPLLGIDDPRSNKRIEFVGGIRGTDELKKRVDEGRSAVAFSMYPTTIDQLMAIADAGAVMPPKSTWFEPKLRSGLLVHVLE
ncbi:MAG TPA: DUF1015 domain-containing protein [Verrucomicrobia bacterium]|nr:MAG: hypothetical protein A2X46_07920 [Lentisphaerae bacterium GWF2_57_35]HBA84625.1 DUF1015 domain-containing protein [Verrucomicrobiota bacterium]